MTGTDASVAGPPAKNCSRLLCPRRLCANTTYLACVVPIFETGRLAGLRQDVAKADRIFAWARGDASDPQNPKVVLCQNAIDLPVYYSWEFTTGLEGDFEALVNRLQRNDQLGDLGVGKRPMRLTEDAAGINATLWLEGVLTAFQPEYPAPSDSTADINRFTTALRPVIDPNMISTSDADVIVPPLYGRWHAGYLLAKRGLDQIAWLKELNLDPRWRAAAELGVQVVQDQQEQLMASAWEQVGEIEKANQLLRQAQLARSAGKAIYNRHLLEPLPVENDTSAEAEQARADLILMTSPAHSHLADRDGKTVRAFLHWKNNTIPSGAYSAAFRRTTRSRGRLARRAGKQAGWGAELLTTLNDGGIRTTGPLTLHRDQYREDLPAGAPEIPGTVGTQGYDPSRISLREIIEIVLPPLDPDIAVPEYWKPPRITRPEGWPPDGDPLEPIMAAPQFPQPMYRALREISQELFLPGMDKVPPETLAALYTNNQFVEAYMVGLNHEMGRELLWRGYPTDQRGSYFRHFWDTASQLYTDNPEPDLDPIHTWQRTVLGTHLNAHHDAQRAWDPEKEQRIVLLLRSSLLGRYPRTLIYVVQAMQDPKTGQRTLAGPQTALEAEDYENFFKATRLFPIFQGSLTPDVTFLGFDLTPEVAYGDRTNKIPGWFFVFQQPPTELRFGLDVEASDPTSPDTTARKDWGDLSWEHVKFSGEKNPYIQISAGLNSDDPGSKVKLDLSNEKNLRSKQTNQPLVWQELSSATLFAAVTSQRPALIAVHASDLLPPR